MSRATSSSDDEAFIVVGVPSGIAVPSDMRVVQRSPFVLRAHAKATAVPHPSYLGSRCGAVCCRWLSRQRRATGGSDSTRALRRSILLVGGVVWMGRR